MTTPSWPSGLPYKPRRSEWRVVEPYRQPIATEMDGGNIRLRKRPGDNVAKIEQVIRMSESEINTFWTFIKTTLSNGTARFTMPVYINNSTETTKTVQFVSPPQSEKTGARYAVSMSIYVFGV